MVKTCNTNKKQVLPWLGLATVPVSISPFSLMKKIISLAVAASLTLAAVPALARQIPVKNTVKRTSARTLRVNQEANKKVTPSDACKTVWGTDRAKCMRAYIKAGQPWNWSWKSSASSSVSSTSSTSSAATSATSSAASSASSN